MYFSNKRKAQAALPVLADLIQQGASLYPTVRMEHIRTWPARSVVEYIEQHGYQWADGRWTRTPDVQAWFETNRAKIALRDIVGYRSQPLLPVLPPGDWGQWPSWLDGGAIE